MNYLVGIDIGGTKCAVVLGRKTTEGIEILAKERFPTERQGYATVIDRFFLEVDQLLSTHGVTLSEVEAFGISCGGPLDSQRGVIMSPPNLPGWDNVPIVELFEKRFGVKTGIQNDANACALAEWQFGAGRGTRNMIFLTFGTGMGAGLVLNGALYSGTNDMAGEVGHMAMRPFGPVGYGKAGSFEGFCSGSDIEQLARTRAQEALQMGSSVGYCPTAADLERITARSVAEAASSGDPDAVEVYRTSGKLLGEGLSLLIDLLNPEVIVIGSIFARAHDLLWPKAEQVIRKQALGYAREVCRVVPARLGESIGDYAALSVAAYRAMC
ncbi:MAG: ROK family protein [Alistipes sp.]|nr:ROK family protein [Alistipes sp.]